MKTKIIRQKFLDFFAQHNHQVVASSSLIPENDPSLLFSNAGMNQFKDVFLGFDQRSYKRATTAQKCVRAGGKHNDLENVGYTARHHTFFEMMGNFSFGDYFKKEAICFAWEFLTSSNWLNLPKEKLLVTVYAEDDEAYNIWHKEIGLPENKIIRIGDNKGERYASDNFWQMGDTGPCGPSTEIFYDHGEHIWGGVPGSENEDGDRFIEIWNCVFMQFNRDENGVMHRLPKPSVDTGLGLERISAILQGVHSNYEIDLFVELIKSAADLVGVPFSLDNPSLKVIADHIRACGFLLADGVVPSNEGRGYVLRRIIRRAVRHGHKLGQKQPFFYQLVDSLIEQMSEAYPQLIDKKENIKNQLLNEEKRFAQTLDFGMQLLESALKDEVKQLSGKVAFKLYDTYGFPLDLTADICREKNISIDIDGFNQEMEIQKANARANQRFKNNMQWDYQGKSTEFFGYDNLQIDAVVQAIYKDGVLVNELGDGQSGVLVLDKTVFYAESGGQVGDIGQLIGKNGGFLVEDTQKIKANVIGHWGKMTGGLIKVGDAVCAKVDGENREKITLNHSVTHILHAALRKVLGDEVHQKGSLQNASLTRFDVSYGKQIEKSDLNQVEKLVNQIISANLPIKVSQMTLDEAKKTGAMMLFGEKYGDIVRVVEMGDFSIELCGGTHASSTGEIGFFKILSESGIAAGVRRIEAICGDNAVDFMQQQQNLIDQIIKQTKAQNSEDICLKIKKLADDNKSLEKKITKLQQQIAQNIAQKLWQSNDDLPIKILTGMIENADLLRDVVVDLIAREQVIALLWVIDGDRVYLCAGVSKDLQNQLKAGTLVNWAANLIGAKGGGRADIAQAAGGDKEKLSDLSKNAAEFIRKFL